MEESMKIPPLLIIFAVILAPAFTAHSIETPIYANTIGKCGTPQVLEQIRKRGKVASRLILDTSILSSGGHFRVHYDTTGVNIPNLTDLDQNLTPDYIDSTLAFLEYAWDLEVNVLGFRAPRSDNGAGGGNEIDVYIQELGNGNYGVTYPDQISNGTSSAYIILDNNYSGNQYYSKGLDGLRVTSAHEFFHVIQFGYLYDPDWNLLWWMEQSATWMENRAWDDINDYLNYLWFFFRDSHLPINSINNNFEYGAVIWPMYLSKRFGEQIIRNLWETLAASPKGGISCFNDIIPTGLDAALNEFGIWNYFTKDRANTEQFYSDGNLFPYSVSLDLQKYESTPDSLNISSLSSSFAEILFIGDWGQEDGLKINFSTNKALATINSLIFYNTPRDYMIHHLGLSGEILPLGKKWNRAVLVSTCANTFSTNGRFRFTAEWYNVSAGVAERPLSAFAFSGAYPNPFNPSTTIRFILPKEGKVTINAYNITGQKVANLFDGVLSAGEKNILWKPSGLSGGVYFVTVASDNETRTAKVLLLK